MTGTGAESENEVRNADVVGGRSEPDFDWMSGELESENYANHLLFARAERRRWSYRTKKYENLHKSFGAKTQSEYQLLAKRSKALFICC